MVEGDRMVDITRVLCPVDFSDCSRRALDYAIAIGRWFGADIEVLHVVPQPLVAGRAEMQIRLDVLRTEAYADAVAEMKQFVESASSSGVPVHVSVERGEPAAHIVARAPSAESGLVVMGTHGRSGFERLVSDPSPKKSCVRSTARCSRCHHGRLSRPPRPCSHGSCARLIFRNPPRPRLSSRYR